MQLLKLIDAFYTSHTSVQSQSIDLEFYYTQLVLTEHIDTIEKCVIDVHALSNYAVIYTNDLFPSIILN